MKLSPHLQCIKNAFATLMSSFDDLDPIQDYHHQFQGRRVRTDLPRTCHRSEIPRICPTYQPQKQRTSTSSRCF